LASTTMSVSMNGFTQHAGASAASAAETTSAVERTTSAYVLTTALSNVASSAAMADVAPHQDPWFHAVFFGTAAGVSLGEAIAAVASVRGPGVRRCVALVGADGTWWREERLIEGTDGSLVLEIDSHRGEAPHREALPAELSKSYDVLVKSLRRFARDWPSSDGLHREPGSPRSDTIVVLEAATLEGRALMGASAVEAFRKLVFPRLDVAALKKRSG